MATRRYAGGPWRDWFRWRVAYVLDRSRRVCWTDCVSWALATREEQRNKRQRHPLREVVGTSTCQRDAAQTGACYCGKFRDELDATRWLDRFPALDRLRGLDVERDSYATTRNPRLFLVRRRELSVASPPHCLTDGVLRLLDAELRKYRRGAS